MKRILLLFALLLGLVPAADAGRFHPRQVTSATLSFMWDMSDRSQLRQASDGSTAVTAQGDPVGYITPVVGSGTYIQATSARRPTYNTDGTLSFLATADSGNGQYLASSSSLTPPGGGSLTVVYVAQATALGANQDIFQMGASSGGLQLRFTSGNLIQLNTTAGSAMIQSTQTIRSTTLDGHMGTLTYTTASTGLGSNYINGLSDTTKVIDDLVPAPGAANFIGARSTSLEKFTGKIGCIMIFTGVLSAADRMLITDWCAAKWPTLVNPRTVYVDTVSGSTTNKGLLPGDPYDGLYRGLSNLNSRVTKGLDKKLTGTVWYYTNGGTNPDRNQASWNYTDFNGVVKPWPGRETRPTMKAGAGFSSGWTLTGSVYSQVIATDSTGAVVWIEDILDSDGNYTVLKENTSTPSTPAEGECGYVDHVSTTVTTGAASATQTVASTAGMTNGMVLYFTRAGVTRTISSVTDATHVVLTASVTTLDNELVKNTEIYIRLPGSVNPNGHTVEVAQYDWCFGVKSQSAQVDVYGLEARGGLWGAIQCGDNTTPGTLITHECRGVAARVGNLAARGNGNSLTDYNGLYWKAQNDCVNSHGDNSRVRLINTETSYGLDEGRSKHDASDLDDWGGRSHHNQHGGATHVGTGVVTVGFIRDMPWLGVNAPTYDYNWLEGVGLATEGGFSYKGTGTATVYACIATNNHGAGFYATTPALVTFAGPVTNSGNTFQSNIPTQVGGLVYQPAARNRFAFAL